MKSVMRRIVKVRHGPVQYYRFGVFTQLDNLNDPYADFQET